MPAHGTTPLECITWLYSTNRRLNVAKLKGSIVPVSSAGKMREAVRQAKPIISL